MTVPSVPGAITIGAGSLTGSELVAIATVGPQVAQTTTAAIAALAADSNVGQKITAITTAGAGSLTAAAIVGANILRSGPSADFTDTTVAASAIIAALPSGTPVGSAFKLTYINNTNFVATIAAGSSVTMKQITGSTGNVVVQPNSVATLLVTLATTTTVTIEALEKNYIGGATGTFVANGASAVTVANAAVTENSAIIVTLKTVGGTVGAIPAIQTITPGTGFTIAGTSLDTSTYNYLILG